MVDRYILLGECKAEAGAALGIGCTLGRSALVELLEDVWQLFGGNARAVIGDAELDAVGLLVDSQADVTAVT